MDRFKNCSFQVQLVWFLFIEKITRQDELVYKKKGLLPTHLRLALWSASHLWWNVALASFCNQTDLQCEFVLKGRIPT